MRSVPMIPYEIGQAILTLHSQGLALREISRRLKVSRNAVRRVLRRAQSGPRQPSAEPPALLQHLPELYRRCHGNGVRIQEVLKDEYSLAVPYSTLTRRLREQELRSPKRRSGIYTFGPGQEMQHDTSPHRLHLGQRTVTAQCASSGSSPIAGCCSSSTTRPSPALRRKAFSPRRFASSMALARAARSTTPA